MRCNLRIEGRHHPGPVNRTLSHLSRHQHPSSPSDCDITPCSSRSVGDVDLLMLDRPIQVEEVFDCPERRDYQQNWESPSAGSTQKSRDEPLVLVQADPLQPRQRYS